MKLTGIRVGKGKVKDGKFIPTKTYHSASAALKAKGSKKIKVKRK